MESLGEMETALQYYEKSKDFLSLVRVYCYCSNLEKAAEIANDTGDRAANYHMGRQYENKSDIKKAVHFFSRAQAYSHAIRICKVSVSLIVWNLLKYFFLFCMGCIFEGPRNGRSVTQLSCNGK